MKSSKTSVNSTGNRSSRSASNPDSSNEDYSSRIAVAAYYKAESRGFAPGNELDDWFSAEAEAGEKKSW